MIIDLPQCSLNSCRYEFDGNCTIKNRYKGCEFAHFKELEAAGRLIELPCKTVYYFDNKLLMSKPIDFLTVYEVLGIDEDGKYWSTIEKATAEIAKLAELKGVNNDRTS